MQLEQICTVRFSRISKEEQYIIILSQQSFKCILFQIEGCLKNDNLFRLRAQKTVLEILKAYKSYSNKEIFDYDQLDTNKVSLENKIHSYKGFNIIDFRLQNLLDYSKCHIFHTKIDPKYVNKEFILFTVFSLSLFFYTSANNWLSFIRLPYG